MVPEVIIIADIPHAAGRGRRVIGVDEHGVIHVFLTATDEAEVGQPAVSFVLDEARGYARDVLAGFERTVTSSPVHLLLAAAVVTMLDSPGDAPPAVPAPMTGPQPDGPTPTSLAATATPL